MAYSLNNERLNTPGDEYALTATGPPETQSASYAPKHGAWKSPVSCTSHSSFGGTGFPACANRLAGAEARPTNLFIIYRWPTAHEELPRVKTWAINLS
jgi:hypothetical protein